MTTVSSASARAARAPTSPARRPRPRLKFLHRRAPGLATEIDSVAELASWIANDDEIDANPSAACAIELALLDLLARRAELPVERVLGLDPLAASPHASAVYGDYPGSGLRNAGTHLRLARTPRREAQAVRRPASRPLARAPARLARPAPPRRQQPLARRRLRDLPPRPTRALRVGGRGAGQGRATSPR